MGGKVAKKLGDSLTALFGYKTPERALARSRSEGLSVGARRLASPDRPSFGAP
jgi:hypothetical protein